MKRHFEDLQLGSIELFCLAAEAGSFTAAAQAPGVTPAAVSRSISRMEERLGARLFVRTTRSIRLTDSGSTFFEQCREALTQLVEVLKPFGGRSRPFTLLYPHGRYVPHRVRAFVDFLLACRDEWATR
ncbi:LysR family transcriptional regulator [Pseudomonas salomonii]|uniref:LysR family transcriptional regulator n=1 Tax=Pseudomonas salomonii TaxID=191391 RepID=A0ABS9GPB2_9PSED|nr:LysR family transcriptional regulator [Pseudomonas salomonii]MCF5546239.1 LysR family transcriptional regulator [Pseudomonas salomonii]